MANRALADMAVKPSFVGLHVGRRTAVRPIFRRTPVSFSRSFGFSDHAFEFFLTAKIGVVGPGFKLSELLFKRSPLIRVEGKPCVVMMVIHGVGIDGKEPFVSLIDLPPNRRLAKIL